MAGMLAAAAAAAAAAPVTSATGNASTVMCADRTWMIFCGTSSSVTGHFRLSFAFVPIVPSTGEEADNVLYNFVPT